MFTRVCCIGFGSVGKRHAENLKKLGHEVSVYDISEEARSRALKDGYCIYPTLKEALDSLPEIVLICTDTSSHIPIIQEVLVHDNPNLKGIFCEKPISYNIDGVSTIINMCKERNIKLMVGENLQFYSGVVLVKTFLNNNTIGKVFSSSYFFGHDLKKWHPDTDYTKSYSAGTNGGISLDDIHAIALSLDLFGEADNIRGVFTKTETLKISNEDLFDCIIKHKNGVASHISSNYLSPEYERTIEIHGTGGIIQLDFFNGTVSLKTPAIEQWRTFGVNEPINEMYERELKYYMDCINTNTDPIHHGIKALELLMELKK